MLITKRFKELILEPRNLETHLEKNIPAKWNECLSGGLLKVKPETRWSAPDLAEWLKDNEEELVHELNEAIPENWRRRT